MSNLEKNRDQEQGNVRMCPNCKTIDAFMLGRIQRLQRNDLTLVVTDGYCYVCDTKFPDGDKKTPEDANYTPLRASNKPL
ncbi:hypothetical protein [Lactococcus sp. DD01]|uniref:hypothetical protein n=1 Tax=Lactococcus sp. DD01 TaxID=1776443 RepID=UPI000776A9F5|nr:hypothetical protein [Lactococcus sp. DD01]